MNPQTYAHIDLPALRHNFNIIRAHAGSRKILTMIKSNGYGHSMVSIAKALPMADAFGVAAVEEGIMLREAGITQPIVVMSRFTNKDQLPLCLHFQLTVVVHQMEQVALLEKGILSKPISVWLKVDTGMNRLGLSVAEFTIALQRLNHLSWVVKPIVLMTHLACADTPDHPLNNTQIKRFHDLTINLQEPKSIANSAAILTNPESLADWVRPGIMLYGVSPMENTSGAAFNLKPVMTLTSVIIAIHSAARGETVGYGATWQCPEDMMVGIAAVGYGDGYPRHAISGTPVLVNGQKCSLIGRVSMDMIAIDLRPLPKTKIGDPVILWGQGLPIETIAACSQTIAYELFCGLTGRVSYIYHE